MFNELASDCDDDRKGRGNDGDEASRNEVYEAVRIPVLLGYLEIGSSGCSWLRCVGRLQWRYCLDRRRRRNRHEMLDDRSSRRDHDAGDRCPKTTHEDHHLVLNQA